MKNKDILMAVTRTTLITGLLIVMYACGKEDIEIENINQIKFTAEVNAQFSTRAALTGTEVENIGIFAYSSLQDIDELFENEELTKQDGYFEYSTQARYYQKDEEISYLAYSPYNEEISYAVDETNNKVTFSGYKLPNGYAEEDLLLSGFTTENTSIVSIHFKHALSALGFKVKGDPNYKVTYLAICRIYNNADFSLDNQGNIEWSNRSIDIADSDQTTIFPVNLADSTTPSSTDTAISLI